MKKLYLIDASSFLYRSYFAISSMTDSRGESTNALYGFIRSVLKLIKEFNPNHVAAIFDGFDNKKKRREIYPDYKANRDPIMADLPHQIQWAEDFCRHAGIPFVAADGVEADDTIGSIALWAEKQGYQVYICSSDKDLAQLVSDNIFILNTFKNNLIIDHQGVEELFGVPPEKIVDYLALAGDTSDNVPGLPGFGPKTASNLLQKLGSLDYILKHPQEVPGKKKQETIINQGEQALLSKRLVMLDTEVEFPHSHDFFKLKQCDSQDLKDFYLEHDFHTLVHSLPSNPSSASDNIDDKEEKVTYHLVDDPKKLKSLIDKLKKAEEVCFDTETTDVHPLKAELVGIGFCLAPKEAWYVPINGQLGLQKVLQSLAPLFRDPKLKFYGHNVKYDYHVLANYGLKVATISFDTILASYLLNAHSRQHSLDTLALHYFSKTKTPIKELIGSGKNQITMAQVPIDKVCNYCCEDVDYTCRLKKILDDELEERGLKGILTDIELPLLAILAKMERQGIYVNVQTLHELSTTFKVKIEKLRQEIFTLAGQEFTINSPKQLSEILFVKLGIKPLKKTQTGYSTDADVLETLQQDHPIAAKILAYRTLNKLCSTYLDALPNEILPKTNRIHTTFNQSVTATGRLSCQNPNLQNIPIRTEEGRMIRQAFQPQKEGWSYLAADYSQIELRLLAHLSQDPSLLKAFQNHEDIHTWTASQVLNIPLDQVNKEQRRQAKAVNFGIIYGQQAYGLSQELGISFQEAAAFIKQYFAKYSKVEDYISECKEKALQSGKSTTLIGRERAIPEIDSNNKNIRSLAERLAVNTPLQGTAADLIKLAMIELDKRLTRENLQAIMILQIHDELIFEVADHDIDKLSAIVKEVMENIYNLTVPLTVDIAVGKNWAEC
ncbi:MAG: DNA polymerase I [Chlamydiota bacterium]